MNHHRHLLLLALAAICPATPVFQVTANGGTHASLQAAVDACPATGCRIELTDSVYAFTEPVSIRGKAKLSITGARPDGRLPVLTVAESAKELAAIPALGGHSPAMVAPILWSSTAPDTLVNPDGSRTVRRWKLALGEGGKAVRFLLAAGRSLDGSADAARPSGWLLAPFSETFLRDGTRSLDQLNGYLHAGLLQVDSSRQVQIEGLSFQLDAPIEFGIQNLWNDRYSQPGSLAAVSLNRSLEAKITHCEFSGWSTGIRSVDNNSGGLVSDLMSQDHYGSMLSGFRPLANPAAMGGHRIEGNLARHNRNFVHLESAWDLACSIRFNRIRENGLSYLVPYGGMAGLTDGELNRMSGAILLKDVVYPSTVVQGNTFSLNSTDLAWMGWRASTGQLFLDNLSQRDGYANWSELTGALGPNARSNWILTGDKQIDCMAMNDCRGNSPPVIPFCTNATCLPLTPAWGASAVDQNIVGKGFFGDDLGAVWSAPRMPESIRIQDQTLGNVTRTRTGWKVLLPVPLETHASISGLTIIKAIAQKVDLQEASIPNWGTPSTLSPIGSLEGISVIDGINLLSFEIPAAVSDSIWRVEMAVQGTDMNTGKSVHSNLGTWLVRPLGKQLQVTQVDKGEVQPGSTVRFQVKVIDSLGNASNLGATPSLNAQGWSLAPTAAGRVAGRAGASGTFEVAATAPIEPGLSQVVFWGVEDGRIQAVPGAAYVQVGARASGIGSHRAASSNWSLGGLVKQAQGWSVQVKGATAMELAKARLVDARGHAWSVGTSGTALSLPALPAGTYFLNLGGKSRSLALIP